MKNLFVLLSFALTLSACAERDLKANADKYRIVAGILTQNPVTKEWYLTEDAGHTTVGVASVHTEPESILIRYNFEGKKVVTFVATGDASYTERGFVFGGQIGTNAARLFYGAPNSQGVFSRVSTEDAYVLDSNVMFYALIEVE